MVFRPKDSPVEINSPYRFLFKFWLINLQTDLKEIFRPKLYLLVRVITLMVLIPGYTNFYTPTTSPLWRSCLGSTSSSLVTVLPWLKSLQEVHGVVTPLGTTGPVGTCLWRSRKSSIILHSGVPLVSLAPGAFTFFSCWFADNWFCFQMCLIRYPFLGKPLRKRCWRFLDVSVECTSWWARLSCVTVVFGVNLCVLVLSLVESRLGRV